jgi:hypothetical protein
MSFQHCIDTSMTRRSTVPDPVMKDPAREIKDKVAGFLIALVTCGIFWLCAGMWVYLALRDNP